MKKLFYLLILTISLASCVKDSDYETPQIASENPVIPADEITSIQNIRTKWYTANPTETSSNVVLIAEADDDPIYLSGYVVSSDHTGNFYKELFIQDSIENPTYAIKIAVDIANLYLKYNVGRKIYLKLNGLAVNRSHGELVIGEYVGGALENIRENLAKEVLLRNATSDVLTPKTITLDEVGNTYLGMYVKLENLQFDLDLVGQPFVDPYDSYDSYRAMLNCAGLSLALETSTFASFKDLMLPNGNGSVIGILSRNYDDDFYVLRVNSPEDFSFDGQRCDALFQDGFGNGFTKWTTINVAGPQVWAIDTQYGNPGNCAKMSGYSGGAVVNEDWLISNSIDLTGIADAKLNFQTAKNYTGNALQVMISTNYTAGSNPEDADWTLLSATLSSGSFTWTNSGDISLAPYVGNNNVRIAFVYTSTSSGASTWEVDNVKVSEL